MLVCYRKETFRFYSVDAWMCPASSHSSSTLSSSTMEIWPPIAARRPSRRMAVGRFQHFLQLLFQTKECFQYKIPTPRSHGLSFGTSTPQHNALLQVRARMAVGIVSVSVGFDIAIDAFGFRLAGDSTKTSRQEDQLQTYCNVLQFTYSILYVFLCAWPACERQWSQQPEMAGNGHTIISTISCSRKWRDGAG